MINQWKKKKKDATTLLRNWSSRVRWCHRMIHQNSSSINRKTGVRPLVVIFVISSKKSNRAWKEGKFVHGKEACKKTIFLLCLWNNIRSKTQNASNLIIQLTHKEEVLRIIKDLKHLLTLLFQWETASLRLQHQSRSVRQKHHHGQQNRQAITLNWGRDKKNRKLELTQTISRQR